MTQENIQSPEKVTFKKPGSEDWERFRKIRLEALQTDPQAFGGNFENELQENELYWREKLSNQDRSFYVAEENSDFVATAGARKIDDTEWMLSTIYTSPSSRGKGISNELLLRIIHEAKKSGVKKVSLNVNSEQENAVDLYKKLGFKIIAEGKGIQMGDGIIHHEYYMEKELDSLLD